MSLFTIVFAFILLSCFVSEVECWADFDKRVIPVIIGATVVALVLISVLTFQFIKDRHRSGYDRIWAQCQLVPQSICFINILMFIFVCGDTAKVLYISFLLFSAV